MSGGRGPVMLPTSAPAPDSHFSHLSRYLSSSSSSSRRNTPEEDDETMSKEQREDAAVHKPGSTSKRDGRCLPPEDAAFSGDSLFDRQVPHREQGHKHNPSIPQFGLSYDYQPHHSFPGAYSQPTPFPSHDGGQWLHPSFASSWSEYPNSLSSCLSDKDYSSCSGASCHSGYKFLSLPGRHSTTVSSLEQPLSLRSNPPSASLFHHTLSPYSCSPQGAACCAQRPADTFSRARVADHRHPWAQHHPELSPHYPGDCRLPAAGYTHMGPSVPVKEKHPAYSTPLSLEQRKVFVTYEADNDKHVNEIIKFVALLRHNGFDTHIDIFEQQFRSISKIDFMERYLSEKEYLIIIIISPKYYETVTASPVGFENDERTFNTVYIHKQLQNEFIQNGSKNFRFIPILFPGAKKSHVPNWLQNTHVYGWPRDRDDILRRLMRVEKYNPPPIGELPTIVSIPI